MDADPRRRAVGAVRRIVLIAPGAGALGLVWVIAAYSIAFGISFVALALRLRNHKHGPAAA